MTPSGERVCGVPPANNGDFAWVEHMVTVMRPETGPPWRSSCLRVFSFAGSRKQSASASLEEDLLEAVIGLPAEPLLLNLPSPPAS